MDEEGTRRDSLPTLETRGGERGKRVISQGFKTPTVVEVYVDVQWDVCDW